MVPYPSSQGRIRKHQCPAFRWFIDLCQLLCWFPINSWICICQVGIVSRLNKIGKRRSWVTNYIDSFFFVLLFCFFFFFFFFFVSKKEYKLIYEHLLTPWPLGTDNCPASWLVEVFFTLSPYFSVDFMPTWRITSLKQLLSWN